MKNQKHEVKREHDGSKRMPTFAATRDTVGARRTDYLRTGGYRVLPDGSIETASLIEASKLGD